ncbi:MAG: autotransporter outer membrane beta-barrel domain-containing protein, partial [Gammaproteobacteria bacterium]|nr:autotransporter outer membrane beta-barrel domain-containing protein [Gammaproteobacteria bacterium]
VDKTGGDSLKNLNYSVLPVATQFGLASAMNNIQTRATASRSGSDRQAVFSLSGDTTTESVLMTHMKGAAALDDANDYEYDWKKAFSNSSFSMPIFGAGGGTLWASGDYRTMNGDSGVVDWEGNSFLFNFGADARLNNDMLVGLMISMSDTDIDYTDTALDTTNKGEYTITNLALRPYFAWSVGRTDIWGSIGTGSGEVEVVQEGETMARVGDTSESSLSLGVKHALVEGLSVQADISTNSTTVDEKNGGSSADGGVDSQDIDSQRARVLLVGENSYNSANGTITPKVEIGFRFDSSETNNAFGAGDSTSGSQEDNSTGTEAAMGVDVASGGRVMGLKARFYSGNDYDEWGISGIYEHHVGAGGLGLAMAMRPQYGNTASTTKSLFQQEFDNASNVKKTTVADAVNAPSMNSDISYGFAAPGDRGVITPYAKAVLGSNVATSSRLGMRWKPHSRFNVDVYGDNKAAADDYAMLLNWASKGPLDFALEGKRTEKAAGDISHSVVLKGTLDF